jgi:hypothetical protein
MTGAFASVVAAGLIGAAVLGAIPGSFPLVALAAVMASAGAHLARSDAPTRPRAETAAAAVAASIPYDVLTVAALGAGFLRWRAADLGAIRGAQAVLGPGLIVMPGDRLAAVVLAALAIVVAGGARVAEPEPAPRRRPPGLDPALAAIGRWSATGSAVLLGAALVAGPAVGGDARWSSPSHSVPVWTLGVLVAAAAAGTASAVRRPPLPRWAMPGLAALMVAGAFVLGSV